MPPLCTKYGTPAARSSCCRFEQRQAHHAGVAAVQRFDEHRGQALDGIGAGLVPRLAGFPVGARIPPRSRSGTARR